MYSFVYYASYVHSWHYSLVIWWRGSSTKHPDHRHLVASSRSPIMWRTGIHAVPKLRPRCRLLVAEMLLLSSVSCCLEGEEYCVHGRLTHVLFCNAVVQSVLQSWYPCPSPNLSTWQSYIQNTNFCPSTMIVFVLFQFSINDLSWWRHVLLHFGVQLGGSQV